MMNLMHFIQSFVGMEHPMAPIEKEILQEIYCHYMSK